jgi:NDP-sugar pyrophosphorylase family protein
MSLPVAILAGGLATRLGQITADRPKALVDVAGRPFAEHQIELLRRHGVTRIVFLVGHLGERVEEALGDGRRWGVTLRYVFDGPSALGTGGAVRNALPELGSSFFVLYGDSYLECEYGDIARMFVASGADGMLTV